MTRSLRIAMIGCRGVPATFGGIERHVEEVGARLANRGHQVTVYCRRGYAADPRDPDDREMRENRGMHDYRGMHTVNLPTIATKHLEAMSHSAIAAGCAVLQHHDVYHFHALGPGLMTPLARLSHGGAAVLTVHGLDFERDKWGSAASKVLRQGERVGARWAHAVVVVAPDLVERYESHFGIRAAFIRNGVSEPSISRDVPTGRYVLFVGRLTPEKRPNLLLDAFRRLPDPDLRLIVVGGSSHTDQYVARLHQAALADPRIELRGYVYGQELEDLYAGARLFVQPSRMEGMPLTVLEAAAHGAPLLTSDIPVHRSILGRPGPGRHLFRCDSVADLERRLRAALAADDDDERTAARLFGEQILQRYSWEDVVDELEELYVDAARAAHGESRREYVLH